MKKQLTKLVSLVLSLVLLASVFAAVPVNTQAATTGTMNSGTGWLTKIDDPDVNGDGVIKVLGLGNSFMMDARQYLTMIFNQVEDSKPFMLASTFYGSCTEQMYINFINNKSKDVVLQTFYSADFPEEEKFIPEGQTGYYNTIEHFVTAANDWDIIVFMSASGGYAAKPSVQTEYKDLIEKMLKKNGNTTPKFAYFMSWAYVEGCTYAGVLANCGGDPMVQYQNIINSITDNVVGSGLFDFVMPMGTTIQNLRTTYEKNRVNPEYTGVNDNLCRDGFHLDYSLGRWAAALTWASSLGLDISDVQFDPTASSASPIGKIEIKINDVQTISAKEAVANALANPTGVTQSKFSDQPYEYPCTAGKNHTYGNVTTYPKTCSEEGYSEKTCSNCSYTYLFDYVDASHEYKSVVTQPTCTMGGYTTHTCTVCGYVTTDTKVKALGHKYVDTVTEKTCTTNGNIHHRCTVCGFEYNDVIEACHEISSWTVVTEATYESTGLKKGVCDDCGETITEVIPMLNNDVIYDWDYSNKADYDETIDNSLKLVGGDKGDALLTLFKYSEDDGVYRVHAPVDAYPYNENNNSVNMPFASYGGFRGFLINTPDNTYANEFTLKGGIGRALHPYGETKKEAAIPGVIFAKDDQGLFTFQVDVKLDGWVSYGLLYVPYTGGVPSGSTTHVKAMKNCTGTYYIESVDGVATQPTYLLSNLNDRGLTGGIEITEDNYYDVQVEYHVSYNNDTGETTIYADLLYDKDGVKWTATCESFTFSKHSLLETYPNLLSSFNHDSYTSAFGMANYAFFSCAEEIFAAGTSGYNTTDVYAINAHYAEGDACNHATVNTIPAVEATCTTAGSKEEKYCAVCDAYLSGGETINALGHNYQVSTAAPNCTVNGITQTECSRCDYSNITEAPALGHTFSSYNVDVAPTCTEKGSASGYCSTCGKTVVDALAANGHSFGEWKVVTAATTTSKGSKTRSCSVCGNTETDIIERVSTDVVYDFDYSDTENGSSDANTTEDVVTFVDSSAKATYSGSNYHYYNNQSNTFDMVATKSILNMATFKTPKGYEAYNMHVSADVQSYNNASPAPIVLVATNGDESAPVYYMFQLRCVQGSFSYMVWAYKRGASAATSDGAYSMTPVGTGRIHNWVNYKASTVNGVELAPPNANATTLIGKDKLTAYGSQYNIPLTFSCDVTVVDGVPVITPSATYTDETTGESLVFGFDEIVVDKDFLGLAETDTLVPAFGFGTTTSDTISAYSYDGLNTGNGDRCKYNSVYVRYIAEGTTAHVHTYAESKKLAPACEEDGYITYTCTDCGNSYNEVLSATGHTYGEYTVLESATVGETGILRKTCSTCAETSDRFYFLSDGGCADGHIVTSYTVVTEATCETAGERVGVCEICGQTLREYNPALGHDLTTVTTNATCTEAGSVTTSCSRCDYENTATIPATGHKLGAATITKEPTCTEAGSKTASCTACDYKSTEDIPALGHSFTNATVTKEPTCTEEGTEVGTCSACGEQATNAIPAKGHSYSGWVVEKQPTETEAGLKSQTCSVCGNKITEAIAAGSGLTGGWDFMTDCSEDFEKNSTKFAATAKANTTPSMAYNSANSAYEIVYPSGFYSLSGVLVKNANTAESFEAVTGYKFSGTGNVANAIIPGVVYATDDNGMYAFVANLTRNANGTFAKYYVYYMGGTISEDGITMNGANSTGTGTIVSNKDINVAKVVVTEKATGEVVTNADVSSAFNSLKNDTEKGIVRVPTDVIDLGAVRNRYNVVTADGTTTITVTMIYSDDTYTYEYTFADCVANSASVQVGNTTTNYSANTYYTGVEHTGYTANYGVVGYSTANSNGIAVQIYSVSVEGGEGGGEQPHEHSYNKVVTAPTCETEGYTTYTCSTCGDSYVADKVVALGHDLKTTTVDATCETAGSTTTTCLRCDYEDVVTIPANGHNFSDPEVTKPATCTEAGEKTGTCTACGEKATEEIPALGHDTTTTTVDATCETAGSTTTTCSRCDYEKVEEIPALGHDLETVTVDATCTTAGSTTTSCSRCDYEDVETIPALGHTESGWIIDKEATETEAGSKHIECTVCGETLKTETIPATGGGNEPEGVVGDANGDGFVSIIDAVIISRHSSKIEQMTGNSLLFADVNGDGTVTVVDAIIIARFNSGLITEL